MSLYEFGSLEYFLFEDNDDDVLFLLLSTKRNSKRVRRAYNRSENIAREFEQAEQTLGRHYFADNALYTPNLFRRRFRMSREVFNFVIQEVLSYNPRFQTSFDCTGKKGIAPLVKVTACMRLLGYGFAADSIDEYCQIGETTALDYLKDFCKTIVACLGPVYLRRPYRHQLENLQWHNKSRNCAWIA